MDARGRAVSGGWASGSASGGEASTEAGLPQRVAR